MAQKPQSKKRPQKRVASPPVVETRSAAASSSRRAGILILLLILVAILGLTLRGTEMRTWWLSRQSLEALHTAASNPSSDALTRYIYAKRLFDANDDEKALDAFFAAEQALLPNENDATAEHILAYLGYLLVTNKRDEEAETRLTHALKLNDDDIRVHLGLGMLLMNRKLYNKAEVQFRIVVQEDGRNAEGWYRLGHAYLMEESYAPAVEAYLRALAFHPPNPLIYADLGAAYARQKKFDLAAPQFKKAVELYPNNQDYQFYYATTLGFAAQTDAEYQTAVAVLTDYMRRNPRNSSAEAVMGKLQFHFNHPKEAAVHLRRYLQTAPNDRDIWFTYAQALRRQGDSPEYRNAEQHAVALTKMMSQNTEMESKLGAYPKDIGLIRELAQFYAMHGNYIDALNGYRHGLNLQPNNAELQQEYKNLKQVYARVRQQNPGGDYSHCHLLPAELQAAASEAGNQNSSVLPNGGEYR